MPGPSLFTQRGSAHPKYFTLGSRIVQLDVNTNSLARTIIDRVEVHFIICYYFSFPFAKNYKYRLVGENFKEYRGS